MIYCIECENACSDKALVCPTCGHRLKSRAYIAGASFPWIRMRWWTGGLLACALGGCLGFLIADSREREAMARVRQQESFKRRAHDELAATQAAQRMTLETISGWREFGGFEAADTSRYVQARAANAAMQFTQLLPEDINLAFGTFGDIEGFSHRDLVELAILAHLHKLDVFAEPLTVMKARVRVLQEQNLERVYRSRGLSRRKNFDSGG